MNILYSALKTTKLVDLATRAEKYEYYLICKSC
jgi:hypothetical protein